MAYAKLRFAGISCAGGGLLAPVQNDLPGLPAVHSGKALLELGVVEPVGNDRREIQAALDHVGHLVPVIHLTAIDALEGQALADDAVHVHRHRLVGDAQQADLAAVAHDGNHLLETS